MSDNKKFGSDIDISLQDRVLFIENLLPSLTRLQEHNEVKKTIQELRDSVDKLLDQREEYKTKIRNLEVWTVNTTCDIKNEISSLKVYQSNHQQEIEEVYRKLKEVASSVNDCNVSVVDISNRQEKMRKDQDLLASKNDLRSLFEKMENAEASLNKKLSALNTKEFEERTRESLKQFKENQESVANTLKIFTSSVYSLDVSQQGYKKEADRAFFLLEDKISKMIGNVKTSFDDKLNSIQIPDVPTKADILREVSSEIEALRLDAKNASARSLNVEMKLALIDKKMEGISLMFQKMELTRKANE
jgi:DNA repair exonuclease SbcCD ATPase subunit